jgi:hypothetical protein
LRRTGFGLNEAIHEYLGKINLQQLVDGQAKHAVDAGGVVMAKNDSTTRAIA